MDFSLQGVLHYFLHLVFPLIIALVFFKKNWKTAYLIMLATMLVDVDHFFSEPIFQANRCSIGFHPLHSYFAICVYCLLLVFKGFPRIIAIGLLFHMLTDLIDCLFIFSKCAACLEGAKAEELVRFIMHIF